MVLTNFCPTTVMVFNWTYSFRNYWFDYQKLWFSPKPTLS